MQHESAYKSLKEKVLSTLQFQNGKISIIIFAGVNLLFLLTTVSKLSFIFLISVILMTVAMFSMFVGFLSQSFVSEETPGSEEKMPEEVDTPNLQTVCSVIYDMANDTVQALRNIIVLKDIKAVIAVCLV